MDTVVIYPGRFHPFHKGHKSVYDTLVKRFGKDRVYIATSNKVDPPKSPFTFDEKRAMMALTGVDPSRVVQVKNPYQATEITDNYDPQNTIALFAVSDKDMAEDPRFSFKPRKDGQPSYYQPAQKEMAGFDKHAYIVTIPTLQFNVLGEPMRSATEFRANFARADDEKQKSMITDLFGRYDPNVHKTMAQKIVEQLQRADEILDKLIELGADDKYILEACARVDMLKDKVLTENRRQSLYQAIMEGGHSLPENIVSTPANQFGAMRKTDTLADKTVMSKSAQDAQKQAQRKQAAQDARQGAQQSTIIKTPNQPKINFEEITDFNKQDPMNSVIAIRGIGTMSISSALKKVSEMAMDIAKLGAMKDAKNVQDNLPRYMDLLATYNESIQEAYRELAAQRRRGGTASRGIDKDITESEYERSVGAQQMIKKILGNAEAMLSAGASASEVQNYVNGHGKTFSRAGIQVPDMRRSVIKTIEQVIEQLSPEEMDAFHVELDNLVHKYFGHSSDEKQEMDEGDYKGTQMSQNVIPHVLKQADIITRELGPKAGNMYLQSWSRDFSKAGVKIPNMNKTNFKIVGEGKKPWFKDGVPMCSKECCGAPVMECTCPPTCEHCNCHELKKMMEGYLTATPANPMAMMGVPSRGGAGAKKDILGTLNVVSKSAQKDYDEYNKKQQAQDARQGALQSEIVPVKPAKPVPGLQQRKVKTTEASKDLDLDNVDPRFKNLIQTAIIKYPFAKDSMDAVLHMMSDQLKTDKQQSRDISRLDKENDKQDTEIDQVEKDVKNLTFAREHCGDPMADDHKPVRMLLMKLYQKEMQCVPGSPEHFEVMQMIDSCRKNIGLDENINEEWSDKYKRSIDCNNPKGFSQRAHCAGRKK